MVTISRFTACPAAPVAARSRPRFCARVVGSPTAERFDTCPACERRAAELAALTRRPVAVYLSAGPAVRHLAVVQAA